MTISRQQSLKSVVWLTALCHPVYYTTAILPMPIDCEITVKVYLP